MASVNMIPTKAEVNLRRLLALCEKRVSEANGIMRGPEKIKFVTNLEHLHKLLRQVEQDAGEDIDKTSVSAYRRQIQRLSDIVDEFKLISPVTKSLSYARMIRHAHQSQEEKNRENAEEMRMVRQAEKELKDQLLQTNQPSGAAEEEEPESARTLQEKRSELFSSQSTGSEIRQRRTDGQQFDTDGGTRSIEMVLQHHRQTQEEISNDLLGMVEVLKMHAQTMHDTAKRDEKIIEETHGLMGGNLGRLRKEMGRLVHYTAQSRKTTWMVWGTVIFVCVMLAFTFIIIRILPKN